MTKRATWIRPVNLQGLLKEVLVSLEGEAVVVLEGDSQALPHPDNLKCSVPIEFKSEAPGADVVALSLRKGNAMPMFLAITQSEGWPTNIVAMQIYKHGHRAFLAGDSFHEECVSLWHGASNTLIETLVSKGFGRIL